MLERLFGGSFETLQQGLDGNAARLKAIGENIANADTPNYKRKEVRFEQFLSSASSELPLAATNPAHFGVSLGPQANVRPLEWTDSSSTLRNDGNNVDIDVEVTRLAQTHATYNTLSELAKRRMEGLKTVLREAR